MNIIIANHSQLIGEGVGLVIKTLFQHANLTVSHTPNDLLNSFPKPCSGKKQIVLIDQALSNIITPEKISHLCPGSKICLMMSQQPSRTHTQPVRRGYDRVIPTATSSTDLFHILNSLITDRNSQPNTSASHALAPKVTPRQLEILTLMSQGLSNKEIAKQCHLTEGTIKRHLSNIFKTLNAKNRVEAVAIARRQGILRAVSYL